MLWNIDYLNSNSQRAYPLADSASRLDKSGSFKIPDELLLDLVLPVRASSGLDVNKFFVSGIVSFGSGVVVALSYDTVPVGSLSILSASHTPGTAYTLAGVGEFADTSATIAIGELTQTLKYGGAWEFTLDNARIVSSLIRPALQTCSAVRVVSAGQAGEWLTGDIELAAGRNTQFVVTARDGGGYRLKVSAISDASLGVACECGGRALGAPIRTICGIGPDASGNIDLESLYSCLKFTAAGNRIVAEDTCSKTCCGCAELDVVTDDLKALNREVATLQGVAARLDQQTMALLTGLALT